ncbi:MAG: hypothetical protein D6675_01550 [Gemmatimonadetes bacterium]|nr:MAG: hypothetical protein D6675_01550 [Gemmatimonadota bacterium]
MTVGEAWDNTSVVRGYAESGLDFCFEFDLATAILNAVNSGAPDYIQSQLEIVADAYPYHQ